MYFLLLHIRRFFRLVETALLRHGLQYRRLKICGMVHVQCAALSPYAGRFGRVLYPHLWRLVQGDQGHGLAFHEGDVYSVAQVVAAPGIARQEEHVQALVAHGLLDALPTRCGQVCAHGFTSLFVKTPLCP